jgi:predicted nucleic acid-binding protein
MICYFDTSALVKLYVEEEGSDLVSVYTRKSLFVATSRVAYAEARSAFARAWRSGVLGDKEYREVVSNFREDWPRYFTLDVSEPVLQRVDSLVDKYSLRGFDALHLASTIVVSRRIKDEKLVVGCWDARLWHYYQQEGFQMIPGERPGSRKV